MKMARTKAHTNAGFELKYEAFRKLDFGDPASKFLLDMLKQIYDKSSVDFKSLIDERRFATYVLLRIRQHSL